MATEKSVIVEQIASTSQVDTLGFARKYFKCFSIFTHLFSQPKYTQHL